MLFGWYTSNPKQKERLQIAAKQSVLCCHLANTNEESDFTFYQISLVLVIIIITIAL